MSGSSGHGPEFPIRVRFLDDGDLWELDDEVEAATSLEWIDSEDPEERVVVTDRRGRRVVLVVEKLEIRVCELADTAR